MNRYRQLSITSAPISKLAPRNADAWFLRAEKASTQQEAMLYLCRVFLLNPKHVAAQKSLYELLNRVLEQDAFLAYIDEEDHFYRVRTSNSQPIIVPKDRDISAPFPSPEQRPLQTIYRLWGCTLISLLFAGIGTLILAPLTIGVALWMYFYQPLNRANRIRILILISITFVVWILSLILSSLLFLHF